MFLLIPIIFFVYNSTFGQSIDSTLKTSIVTTIKGAFKDFATDNLGNIYLVSNTDQIKKLNERGDSIAVYNDVRKFGKINSIDVTNPLKVLVYFKDFSTITVLDRLLNVRSSINLKSNNIWQVKAITSSYDNNIWLFDELDSKIKKINNEGNVIFESNDFRQIFDSVPTPVSIFDRDGQLYLYDPLKGLMIFGYYGGMKNNLQLLHYNDLQVIDKNTITARDSSGLVLYKPALFQFYTFKVFTSFTSYTKIQYNRSRIYCLTKTGDLEIYAITNLP